MTHRYQPDQMERDRALTAEIKVLARRHKRYGYRMITAKLRQRGWVVNHKRVQRIWRKESLQVPYRRKFKKAKGNSRNSCVARKAEHINHVWTYDFVFDQTENGRGLKILTVLDEFTRESLAIEIGRSITAKDVIAVLDYLFLVRGISLFIRSDNGPEFMANAIKGWLREQGVATLYIEPGSPWENGYIESFNGKLRDEVLDRELFYSIKEAKVIVEQWRLEYNNHRPHSGLNYKTPAAFAATCIASASPPAPLPPYTSEQVDNSLIECGT